ncbi:RHOMBOID-like protein 12, mitochondrial [Beta vulgaris subsp. vulgaris]|uniref:RHOMBOID-like protein 12, mitochondrial n=1 Tax=Beta vulgaris subsp. vulgaris TaxID=3555 RepID=UPI002036F95A|nr:RHOMBOID-like protein 12, mitochondrial [Beta vulgaris subsp. vulgaris]
MWQVLPQDFMLKNFTISMDNLQCGRIHTILTCAFSHLSMGHLASDMINLFCFGSSIGRVFGPEFLLKLYVSGAIGGSVCYMLHYAYLVSPFKEQGNSSKEALKAPRLVSLVRHFIMCSLMF